MFRGSGHIGNFVRPYLQNPIQLMDVKLVPSKTAKIGTYKVVLKYATLDLELQACEINHVCSFCMYAL